MIFSSKCNTKRFGGRKFCSSKKFLWNALQDSQFGNNTTLALHCSDWNTISKGFNETVNLFRACVFCVFIGGTGQCPLSVTQKLFRPYCLTDAANVATVVTRCQILRLNAQNSMSAGASGGFRGERGATWERLPPLAQNFFSIRHLPPGTWSIIQR